ncbi:MAG: hypothetical protein CFE26_06765 [Verrucomicrobiales bacterium VVV1]|nr:MAG: hypothetical protein CFE26_06765 [Verrucomicrobiales bacterium VVV1]
MKIGAWFWGVSCLLVAIASAEGWLVRFSPILLAVPGALFAIVAGAFCIGRPGLVTSSRVWSCVFAAVLSVIACTQIPLRARFLASKTDLELTADSLISGSRPLARKVGCFELGAMQVKPDGSVILWTDSHHDNRCALVRTRLPKVLGAVSEIDLGSGWRYALFKDRPEP